MSDEAITGFCCLPIETSPLVFSDNGNDDRSFAIAVSRNKWLNGTTITYHFVKSSRSDWPEVQRTIVRWAFKKWKDLGIGLSFVETQKEADATLLIGFDQNDGSWSYIGTEVKNNRRNGFNMNFGWDLTTAWGKATALHEIGHMLGMPHEHQNPNSGLIWNEQAVLEFYAKPPNNWDEEKTRWNVLRTLSTREVEGSPWDPTSIMHYPVEPGLISSPENYRRQGIAKNTELSTMDKIWIANFYPTIENLLEISIGNTLDLGIKVAQQSDFVVQPKTDRRYEFRIPNVADVKLGLFREVSGGLLEQINVIDNSVSGSDALIFAELEKGKTYRVCSRTHFVRGSQRPTLHVS